MRIEKIEGFGSISGGDYDRVEIEGIGKIRGDIKAGSIFIEGVSKCLGTIVTEEFTCSGIAQLSKSIRAKHVRIEGIVKQTKAKMEADDIYCEGILLTNGEISADSIEVDGCISAPEVYGDRIKIVHCFREKGYFSIPNFSGVFGGRRIEKDYSTVDVMEATNIELYGVKADSVSGNIVVLGPGCDIKHVECDGTLRIHPGAKVGKISGVIPIPWEN